MGIDLPGRCARLQQKRGGASPTPPAGFWNPTPSESKTKTQEASAVPEASGLTEPCDFIRRCVSCPEKVSAVGNWTVPNTVKQVISFVGFCNYWRRIIKVFAKIAQPLHELTKKQARFNWSAGCQLAFDRLRFELITSPMLQFPKNDSPFIVDTDASNVSLGAVIFNVVDGVEQPIVYASRTLSRTEANYSTTKRVAWAVVQALKWFRPYIWGWKFIVRTDHASLHWLFRQNLDG